MAQRLPGCEIHIFDPSLLNANATLVSEMRSRARAYGATVHASGIQPMEGTVRALGHVGRRISYLKVDIDDGSEWGLFLGSELRGKDGLWRACAGHSPLLAIDQLTVELHAERIHRVSSLPPPRRTVTHWEVVRKWFDGADRCGLRTFHKEPNGWGCELNGCMLYSLASADLINRVIRGGSGESDK